MPELPEASVTSLNLLRRRQSLTQVVDQDPLILRVVDGQYASRWRSVHRKSSGAPPPHQVEGLPSNLLISTTCPVAIPDMLRGETRRTALRQWPSPPRQWCSVSAQNHRRHLGQRRRFVNARRFLAGA